MHLRQISVWHVLVGSPLSSRHVGIKMHIKSAILVNIKKIKFNKSLFIDKLQSRTCHKVKFINEKKDRVRVMHIENFTKPLY